MSNYILNRLRESDGGYFMRQMFTEAADEIERLLAEVERLRSERDEARRMWCEAAPVENSLSVDDMDRRARAEAKRRGWDCFKEEEHGKTTMG